MKSLEDYISEYEDTLECNHRIWDECKAGTDSLPWLKEHRDFIEESYRNGVIYGHGDRAFQYMWKLVLDSLPQDFKFLEIGVYKGQIISLIQLISDHTNKNPTTSCVTPLRDDDFAKYNRLPWIKNLFRYFDLTMDNTTIHDGSSMDPEIIKTVETEGPFDVVYVDGDHSYEGAKSDIENYGPMLKVGGLMIIDDASNYKQIDNPKFTGIVEVSDAVRDTLEQDSSYEDVLTVFHNRVFRKVSE